MIIFSSNNHNSVLIDFIESLKDINNLNMNELQAILDSPAGELFSNPYFNVIEEMNINSVFEPREDIDGVLGSYLDIFPRFPNLRYVSLSSRFGEKT